MSPAYGHGTNGRPRSAGVRLGLACFLLWVTPGGHETYFESLVAAGNASPTGFPSPEQLSALMAEHAIQIVAETIPERLLARSR